MSMFDKESYSAALAKNLKDLRENGGENGKKLSHNTLHECLDGKIATESLKNYEAMPYHRTKAYKNMGMSVEALCRLADFYGVSTDYLLGRSEVKHPDANVESAMKCTGLSESNVSFLYNPPEYFSDDAVSRYKESLYALANLFIESCGNYTITEHFQNLYVLINGSSAPSDDIDLVAESVARSRGYTLLTKNDGVKFHASQIAAEIEKEIVKKFNIVERDHPIGRSEEILVNGERITVYKE